MDAILEGLQKRPNVRATLILSRKDGSIIRASGAEFDLSTSPSLSTRQYEEPRRQDSDTIEQSETGASQSEPTLTRLQILAGCIFTHVESASALGNVLQDSVSKDSAGTANADSKSDREEREKKTQHEDEVQLLRVRLRKQEVIIFPDPNYLCCVIQDTEKPGR